MTVAEIALCEESCFRGKKSITRYCSTVVPGTPPVLAPCTGTRYMHSIGVLVQYCTHFMNRTPHSFRAKEMIFYGDGQAPSRRSTVLTKHNDTCIVALGAIRIDSWGNQLRKRVVWVTLTREKMAPFWIMHKEQQT